MLFSALLLGFVPCVSILIPGGFVGLKVGNGLRLITSVPLVFVCDLQTCRSSNTIFP